MNFEIKSENLDIERGSFGACDWELKTEGDDRGCIEGYGSTFNNVDLGKDVVDPKAFDDTCREHEKNGTMPQMFFNHNSNEPIGDWTAMKVDSKGLRLKGKLWLGQNIAKAEQAYNMLRSKTKRGFSIGYRVKKAGYDDKTNIRRLLQLDLEEVSPTPNPMNPKAGVVGVKSILADPKSVITIREAEEILRDAGMSSSEAKSLLAKLRDVYSVERDVSTLDSAVSNIGLLSELNNLSKALSG